MIMIMIIMMIMMIMMIIIIIIMMMIITIIIISKQIAIHKLEVKKKTIKTYLQFISIKKGTIMKHNFKLFFFF